MDLQNSLFWLLRAHAKQYCMAEERENMLQAATAIARAAAVLAVYSDEQKHQQRYMRVPPALPATSGQQQFRSSKPITV